MIKSIFTRPLLWTLLIFSLSLIIRTVRLDTIPTGIVHDNMIFVLNAKAFFYTGSDVTGTWNPLSFSPIPDEPAQAELPYILLAPIIGPASSSLFSAHIFYAVINSFLIVLVYMIARKLSNNYQARIVSLVMCFNPWNIFFGRSAFETSLALFFYILAFYIVLMTTGWKKLWTVVPLAAGFYTYMAYKITFLPFALVICFFTWKYIDRKKYTKQYLTLLGMCVMIFIIFISNVSKQSTSDRLGEVSIIPQGAENQVNLERRIALENPVSHVFSNKIVAGAKISFAKYLGAFSPDLLFIDTEKTVRFHLFNHGYFYYIDGIFLVIGMYYLFRHKRHIALLVGTIFLIAPLPSVINNNDVSYAMRSSLYIPFLCIGVGTGIWFVLEQARRTKYVRLAMATLIFIYAGLIGNFLYTYFFIQPIYASEGTTFSARLLSNYARLAESKHMPVSVVLGSPRVLFKDYVYYTNWYNKETAGDIRTAFLTNQFKHKNTEFVTCDQIATIEKDRTYIFDPGEKCPLFKEIVDTLSIPQLSDSGTVYAIYQDRICSPYNLKRYIAGLRMDDLRVEQLSEKQFCEAFIVDFVQEEN